MSDHRIDDPFCVLFAQYVPDAPGKIPVKAVVRTVSIILVIGIFSGTEIELVYELFLAFSLAFAKQASAVLRIGCSGAVGQVACKAYTIFRGKFPVGDTVCAEDQEDQVFSEEIQVLGAN